MSVQMEQSLSLPQWLTLRSHLLVCHGCRRARKQMRFLRKAAQKIGNLE
jgi:hypothetical protein